MVLFLRSARLGALVLFFAQTFWLGAQNLKPVPALVQNYRDQGIRFETPTLFAPADKLDDAAARFARDAQFLLLDPVALAQIASTAPEALSLQLDFHGQTLTLDLVRQDPLTEDFSVLTSDSPEQAVDHRRGAHYRGVLRGDDQSIAAFSFFDGEMMGLFASPRLGNMSLGRLETPGNKTGYVLYSDERLSEQNPFACQTPESPEDAFDDSDAATRADVNGCVRVYFESDYALFQNKGSVQATVDYLAAVFNQLATLYANESISTRLSQLFIWTTPDGYSTSSSSSALTQFQSFRTSYNADIAHLVGIGGNNLGGIAYVDVLCFSAYSYAYSDITASYSNVPTFSWTVEVLTHEMGHNLGSNHTQWCGWSGGALDNCYPAEGGCGPGPAPSNGGTIMSYCHLSSYGINFANGFGSQPGNKVRSEVGSASCLAASCAGSTGCNAPTGISVSNITGNGATISWTAVGGASSYSLQWRAVGNGSWNTVSTAVSPHALSGLPTNDEIEVSVRSNCGSNNSGYVNGVIFKTGSTGGGGTGGGGGGGTTCNAPSGLSATATSTSSAGVAWSGVSGASSYRISWKLASSGTWGGETTVTGTAYNLNGLAPSTSYSVRVRTACGSTFSTYATTSFTTLSNGGGGGTGGNCAVPANLNATNLLPTRATVSWTPSQGALSYELQIKKASSANWTTFSGLPVTIVTVTGLQPNTAYQVRVRAKCSGNNYSAHTSVKNFTTPSYLPGETLDYPVAADRDAEWQIDFSDSDDARTSLRLSPNPAAERCLVSLYLETAGLLEVIDPYGKVLLSAPVDAGDTQTEVDLTQWPAGLYFVRASASGQIRMTRKLVH